MAESQPAREDEGYLIEPQDWTEEIARAIAAEEGITLIDQHWAVIHFMRESYAEKQVTPDARHAIKHLSLTYGTGRERIFELFPYG